MMPKPRPALTADVREGLKELLAMVDAGGLRASKVRVGRAAYDWIEGTLERADSLRKTAARKKAKP